MVFFCFINMRTKVFSSLLLLFSFIFLHSCRTKQKTPALFNLEENTGIDFSNNITDTKDFNVLVYRNFYNGAGVAIGDINNDGLADIFFTSNQGANKLYLNKGGFKFEDITEKAGFINKGKWATGVIMADVNGDGFLDIYVCYAGYQKGISQENELYINNRNLTFTESAKQYGLNDSGYTTHAAFFDYDMDGDLDCFIINNSFIPVNTLNYANKRDLHSKDWPVADFLKGGGNRLLRNDNGKFVDVTNETGIHNTLISFGLGVNIGDVNGDGYPDVYVSNDFFERDYLYINQKNGTFKDELEQYVQHTSLASMGADIGDINNDGFPDIFTTDMLPDDDYRLKTTSLFDNIDVYRLKERQGFYHQFMQNTLQVNNKDGKFVDVAHYSGVSASDWSWGALMFDMNNDGLNDLYVCNGINHDVTNQDFIDFFANDIIQKMVLTGEKKDIDEIIKKMPSYPLLNKAYLNMGNLKFADTGVALGFTQPSFSNGAAYGDLDNDGDLDLVVNNINQKAFIYKNNEIENEKNNYISVFLKGIGKNTFAIGSTIKIYKGDQIYSREVIPGRGFQSSMDYKQIIGIGKQTQVDSMIIIWPDRTFSKYDHPALNKMLVIQQPSQKGKVYFDDKPVSEPLMQPVKVNFEKHTEDDYVDFYQQRNLPEMLSREGPQIAKGDVNGDGLEDVYIGGAKGQAGQLYLQTPNGFVKKEENIFKEFADFEDVAVLFFDADNDGYLDLFIGSGGNNIPPNSRQLQQRLYINDGKGNFKIQRDAFPKNNMNISVVAANDFDGDGNIDLFVGSRSVPFSYGIVPESYLYKNDGHGHFIDVAKAMNEEIANAGMVTGAAWADVNGDNKKELIITGEWMAPKIFSYNGKTFDKLRNTNLSGLYGLWQTVTAADINGDGKQDLILGNIGENFYLRPDSKNPVKLWINDFDQNGTPDPFLTRTINGKDVPVFLKKDVTDQFPGLRKLNFSYTDYATKTIQNLFSKELTDHATVDTFNYCSSIIAINNGNGKFTIQKLPYMLQMSSINAIAIADVNNDNKMDLIFGENKFGFPPQFGRLDGGFGDVLINLGNNNFSLMEHRKSGLNITGEVKDIKEIKGNGKRFILMTINDTLPVLYKIKNAPAKLQ
ncbi:MAG: VCBS repeat-containing protein [Bacteroidota bacterium]|nr:VCBS repeat-containing protein [Bacteroidota bacterium]